MTTATTYSTLVADLQSYVENDVTEFQAELPKIINRAHARVQRDLELSLWRTEVDTHLTANSRTTARDTSWLKIYSMMGASDLRPITRRSHDYVRMFASTTGTPLHYAEDQTGAISIAPVPSTNYNVHLTVLVRLPDLSTTNETDWITNNVGDLLLWAALAESEHFLISAERVAEFEGEYQRTLAEYRNELRGLHNEEYHPIRQVAKARGET